MRILLIVLMVIFFPLSVYAEALQSSNPNFPQGTFKKDRKGQIIQYDKKGKKIGVYKVSNIRYVKTK